VPVAGGKPQVFFHGFTQNDFIRIIKMKGQIVLAVAAFISNFGNTIEIVCHGHYP